VAMPAFIEVAREWVQNAQVQAWLARVLEELGSEHPVPALPPCGLCDALVLVLLEALQNLDSGLCKNSGVAFHAWLYNLLGGAAEKLVTPPSKGNDATRRLVVSGEATLLPSFAYAYVEHGPGMKSKGKRACADMERIYAAAGNCDKILALITAALEAIAATFYWHTSELQSGGRFAGENVTPELRAQYAGVNVTNTPVERAFGLEKFLHTRAREAAICTGAGVGCCSSTTAPSFGGGS